MDESSEIRDNKVAVERYNTINESGDEFEAALRRHLRQVNGTGQDCQEFDPELVSAYIESALSAKARARYETHLADCVSCRRHVVAMYRLVPEAELAVPMLTQPVSSDVMTERPGWLAGLSRWFDFSAWRWNTAALAGACAVVLLALALPLVWQQWRGGEMQVASTQPEPSSQMPVSEATPPIPDLTSADSSAEGQRPIPGAQAKSDATGNTGNTAAVIPTPDVTPSVVNGNLSSLPQNGRQVLPLELRSGNAASLRQAMPQQGMIVSDGSPQPAPAPVAKTEVAGGQGQNFKAADQVERRDAADLAATSEAREKVRAEAKDEAATQSGNPPGLYLPRPTPPPRGSVAYKEPEKEADARGRATSVAGSGLAAQPRFGLTQKVGSKTFRSSKGVWQDTSFDPKEKWPVIRLRRGSDEYEQTITDIPSLRQFFNTLTGPVVVLWQGTVYDVK